MKALKALVIIMGVLILVALTVVVIALVRRAGEPAPPGNAGAPLPGVAAPSVPIAGAPGAPPSGFGETRIVLPPGAEILETRLGAGRIVLRLREASGNAALLVIDAATGRRLGLVRLGNAAPPGAQTGAPASAPPGR